LSNLVETLKQRRQRLAQHFSAPVLLWSGRSPARNFPANTYPFRASSHFLYFAGLPLEGGVIYLDAGRLHLFMDAPGPASALWHGESPSPGAIAQQIGADGVHPLAELRAWATDAATIPAVDPTVRQTQAECLGRELPPPSSLKGRDRALAEAIIALRLTHDPMAVAEIRQAIAVTIEAHLAGMRATATAKTEAQVRGAIEGVMIAHQLTPAYTSIVTTQGEVLHNGRSPHLLHGGDLLLVDAGAETEMGWAADVTRTFPVSGRFLPSQRAIYDVVLAAHDACITAICPGVEYRDIHLLGAKVLTEGLVDLGILRGNPSDLVEQDVHALFFPHGIGHLLGLDVHDMEDLGDLAGYAPHRQRSDRFGLRYLRLDRPLQAGMVVTIEPGFYQVPALLGDYQQRDRYRAQVNWERLAEFVDVRGIRIEDDVLVTATGAEVLSAALPTQASAIEQLLQAGASSL